MNLSKEKIEFINSYLYLLPTILVFGLFLFGPILYSMYISLNNWSLLTPPKFIGFKNFIDLVNDTNFRDSLLTTLKYTVMYVPSTVLLALISAILLNFQLKGKVIFRALFFFPVITSTVVASVIWKWILHGDYGILNYFFEAIGLKSVQWLGNPNTVLPCVVVVNIWRDFGFYTIILLGGLQSIPSEIYDSAIVEGASITKIIKSITVPLLSPVITVVTVMATVFSLQVFDTIYVMTSGGPVNATSTVVWLIYSQAFRSQRMGYSATIGLVLFAITFIISLAELRFLRVEFEY